MKTLVYENYNKFISATDTIRKVIDKTDDIFFTILSVPLIDEVKC